jgi:ornithine cyclodeaminase/alanine dehydrogenase-like protein (mu-crystallin family)
MAAQTAILAKPDDHRGIITMSEAVDALYDSDTAALKLILVGEMHPKELPDANSVVAMPTACASMVGTDLLARKNCQIAGIFGAGDQAKLHSAGK